MSWYGAQAKIRYFLLSYTHLPSFSIPYPGRQQFQGSKGLNLIGAPEIDA